MSKKVVWCYSVNLSGCLLQKVNSKCLTTSTIVGSVCLEIWHPRSNFLLFCRLRKCHPAHGGASTLALTQTFHRLLRTAHRQTSSLRSDTIPCRRRYCRVRMTVQMFSNNWEQLQSETARCVSNYTLQKHRSIVLHCFYQPNEPPKTTTGSPVQVQTLSWQSCLTAPDLLLPSTT